MLRLLLSKAQERIYFWKPSKPCHVGIHWIALAEYSQMSTHFPRVSVIFFRFLHHFVLAKLATSSIRVKAGSFYYGGLCQNISFRDCIYRCWTQTQYHRFKCLLFIQKLGNFIAYSTPWVVSLKNKAQLYVIFKGQMFVRLWFAFLYKIFSTRCFGQKLITKLDSMNFIISLFIISFCLDSAWFPVLKYQHHFAFWFVCVFVFVCVFKLYVLFAFFISNLWKVYKWKYKFW